MFNVFSSSFSLLFSLPDIDECYDLEARPCDHFCENTEGSYKCRCAKGYTQIGVSECIYSSMYFCFDQIDLLL